MEDRLEDMIHDVKVKAFERVHVYDTLRNNAEKPLYSCCTKFPWLSAVLRLVNLKVINGWSDNSFMDLLCLLKHMLLEDTKLPNRNYKVKKMLCPVGMEYKRMHACLNDCILYQNQYEKLNVCSKYGTSRYKKKEEDDANCDRDYGIYQ